MSVSLITYGLAASAYLLLSALLLTRRRVRSLGPGLLLAAATSTVWATLVAVGTLLELPPITFIQFLELLRNAGWLFFLLQLLGFQEDGQIWRWRGKSWLGPFILLVIGGIVVLGLRPLGPFFPTMLGHVPDLSMVLWLMLATCGLLLVEQVYRNANSTERWGVKFLCLGLGSLFAYDLYMYAEALLFQQLNAKLWQARGFVNALVIPWLVISIGRNRQWRMDMYVSRHIVFHTVTLMGAGIYMLCMALAGYFIKYVGGSWGGVMQIGFLSLAAALLFTLLFSANLRARLRVFVSKHFFSYRYDYREEWLRLTEGLASLRQEEAAEGIIKVMAPIALSKSGGILYRDTNGRFVATAFWEMHPFNAAELGNLDTWILENGWVIDLQEWRRSPDIYGYLELPGWLREQDTLWLIVPLLFQNELEGVLFLSKTELKHSVNWEDRDLLKTAGRQAAALLAQQRTSRALVEARQFDAFNRLSAYVIHDLKNILAQQSLMVANARKHRNNPEFVDDMIGTVDNSVKRMQRLMDQMRIGMRSTEPRTFELAPILESCVEMYSKAHPLPSLTIAHAAFVTADPERLATVFGHLIQNAQEATADDGKVTVELIRKVDRVEVRFTDTGIGMSRDFIRERLFKPFESTKGLTGMGIGAFESREYVRQLGGDITVRSEVGEGSSFCLSLPLSHGEN